MINKSYYRNPGWRPGKALVRPPARFVFHSNMKRMNEEPQIQRVLLRSYPPKNSFRVRT